MIFNILARNLQKVATLSVFESALWVRRYQDAGEFEIKFPADSIPRDVIRIDNFVELDGTDQLACIERITWEGNLREGNSVIISGRSAEIILGRMSAHGVNALYPIKGRLSLVLQKMVNDYCLGRQIKLKCSAAVGIISNIMVAMDDVGQLMYAGDTPGNGELRITPLDVFKAFGTMHGFGFKVFKDTGGGLFLRPYFGTDKSGYIIFSPEKGNLISSDYTEDWTDWKNQVWAAAGQNGGPEINDTQYPTENPSWFTRRAVLLPQIPTETVDWELQYAEVGNDFLAAHRPERAFECEIEPNYPWTFGKDYGLGDIVTIDDGMGHVYRARITESVMTADSSGTALHPTFEIIKE